MEYDFQGVRNGMVAADLWTSDGCARKSKHYGLMKTRINWASMTFWGRMTHRFSTEGRLAIGATEGRTQDRARGGQLVTSCSGTAS
jgi:hypothetical protein